MQMRGHRETLPPVPGLAPILIMFLDFLQAIDLSSDLLKRQMPWETALINTFAGWTQTLMQQTQTGLTGGKIFPHSGN